MKARRRMHFQVLGLLLGSVLLLTVIQPPTGWSSLAWIALVPLIMAATRPIPPGTLAGWAALTGFLYWSVSVIWLQPITTVGWIVYCLYSAPIWAFFALAVQCCHWRRWPLTPCIALLWVGAEQSQGLLLGGFYWRFLAHSQFQNLALIQIADVLGAAGVSFVIAWTNGTIAELLLAAQAKRLHWQRLRPHILIALLLVAGTLTYGRFRLQQVRRVAHPGPRVAAVQSNIPQHVKETFQASDQILTDLLAQSQNCAESGVDLIVWPETMIQGILDETVWAYLANDKYIDQCRAQDDLLKQHAQGNAFVLAGTYGAAIRVDEPNQVRLANYNSANLFRPDGSRDPARYDKIKPILFGEMLPFKNSWPWLHKFMLSLTPYDHDYTLDAGKESTRFHMVAPVSADANDPPPQDYHFGVIICYEDTLPQLSRRFVLDDQGQKQVDWLVNISNDGWFVSFDPDTHEVSPSAELVQHVAACVFRAVENRIGILRSVNTGISCLIDSTGAVRSGYQQASPGFPVPALERQGISGWFTDTLTIDPRITIFSRLGRWPDYICLGVFIAGALVSLIRMGKTSRRIRFSRST